VAAVLVRIKALATAGRYQLSSHVTARMAQHEITLAEMLEVIAIARLLENYPTFYQGPACLIYGDTTARRPIHIVCSTTLPTLILITVYVPTSPKWLAPMQRR